MQLDGEMRASANDRAPGYIGVMRLALAAAVAFSLYVLILGLTNPIMDMYSFRQTQTALTSYWILQGGPWIAYETPVLGAPWAIPFEFPVYQLLVSGLAVLGVPLDVAGRLISFCFFIATLAPLGLLFRSLNLQPASFYATAILYVLSPLYLYWSRTFLIESCALFFSVLWLALLITYMTRGAWLYAVGAAAAGSLAVLSKATTFPAFVVVGGIGVAWMFAARFRGGARFSHLLAQATIVCACTATPFLLGLLWVGYSDEVKSANEFGSYLTSASLSSWNFGSVEQRLSSRLWQEIMLGRIMPDVAGRFYWLALGALAVSVVSKRYFFLVLLAVIGFFSSIMIFTNLHIVHNYYQVANGIFLVAAIGLSIGLIFNRGYIFISFLLISLLIFGQIFFFMKTYTEIIANDRKDDQTLQIALIAKSKTDPSQSLIVLGEDWSSAVAYYSQRKTLTLPNWAPKETIERVFADPQAFLGDRPLGGIVLCGARVAGYGAAAPLVQSFVTDRTVMGEFGGCQLLSPQHAS